MKSTICIFFSVFFNSIIAQNYALDSLKNELLHAKHDTTRVNIISEILATNVPGDSVSLLYNKQLIQLVYDNLINKNCDSLSKRTLYIALAYWYLDEVNQLIDNKKFDKALTYYNNSITIFKYLKDEDNAWGIVANKGHFYRKINEHEKAINCFFDALKYYELKQNDFGMTIANTGIAKVYETQSDYKASVLFYLKAMKYYEQISKPTIQDLSEQVIIYHNIGTCYFHLKDYKNAGIYFNKSLEISIPNKFNSNLSFVYEKLGLINLNRNKFDEAIILFNKGLKYAKKERPKANLWSSLGLAYYFKNDYKNAELYLLKAKKMLLNTTDYTIAENISRDLYLTYKASNQYKKALIVNELFVKYKDANNQENSKNAITKKQLQYDYEKKELELKLKQEKQLNAIKLKTERDNATKNVILIVLISVFILILIASYFFYRSYKQKQAINIFEKNALKQKLLLSQMNPHFIFNSVDNIQTLIYNNQNTDAVKYLGKFSKLTRQILENSKETYITLAEEISMLENYLSIQQLLYNNKFDFNLLVSDTIEQDSILVPPMLTQPFIENAIKHGVNDIEDRGLITVNYSFADEKLFFELVDNGKGFDADKKQTNHKSLAMNITKERFAIYCENKNFKINIENCINTNGNIIGAKVYFEIPYIYEK